MTYLDSRLSIIQEASWKSRSAPIPSARTTPPISSPISAANHDGDLERAKLLIHLAKEAGADAAKFQNFRAPKIVSDYGFQSLGGQLSHQATWKKSVFEVYAGRLHPLRVDAQC